MLFNLTEIDDSGIDTSDATAVAGDILTGKTAYVNGEKITGTIETGKGIEIVPGELLRGTWPAKTYLTSSVTYVHDSNFKAANIKTGTTMWKTTGTYVDTKISLLCSLTEPTTFSSDSILVWLKTNAFTPVGWIITEKDGADRWLDKPWAAEDYVTIFTDAPTASYRTQICHSTMLHNDSYTNTTQKHRIYLYPVKAIGYHNGASVNVPGKVFSTSGIVLSNWDYTYLFDYGGTLSFAGSYMAYNNVCTGYNITPDKNSNGSISIAFTASGTYRRTPIIIANLLYNFSNVSKITFIYDATGPTGLSYRPRFVLLTSNSQNDYWNTKNVASIYGNYGTNQTASIDTSSLNGGYYIGIGFYTNLNPDAYSLTLKQIYIQKIEKGSEECQKYYIMTNQKKHG